MEIKASMVKELRELSGAPMMDCKNALVEAEGDLEMAHKIPMTSSLSFSGSHVSSSVNIVTHSRHEQGMRVISVPQNIRSGPKAS